MQDDAACDADMPGRALRHGRGCGRRLQHQSEVGRFAKDVRLGSYAPNAKCRDIVKEA